MLRIAAAYSLLWAIALGFPGLLPVDTAAITPEVRALARGLAVANLGLALLLWRAALNPSRERWIVYAALLIFGLRAAFGTFEVLYRLEGNAATLRLIDMVLCLAAFTGLLNSLPGVLEASRDGSGLRTED
jgi:heme A synthase